MLSLRQAEVMRAVMVTGSIAGAARMLNVSAPGISRMVRHMEESHGVRLFERAGRGLRATADAEALFKYLEVIHAQLERINGYLADRRGVGEADLAIGCSPGLSQALLPAAIAAFRGLEPTRGLTLDVLHIDEVVPAILTRRVALALTIYPVDDKRVASRPLAEAGLVCLVPEHSPLAQYRLLSAADLIDQPLIGFERAVFQSRLLARLFEGVGGPPPMAVRVRLMASAIPLVQSGLGSAILDGFTVGNVAPSGTRVIPLTSDIRIPLIAIYDAAEGLGSAAQRFLDHVAWQGQPRE